MRRILLSLAFLSLASICLAQSPATGTVTIANVTIIDTTGGPPQLHRTVTVRKGVIDDIRDSTLPKHKDRGVEVNGTGKYLIPGLWDMHVHMVFGDWFPRGKERSEEHTSELQSRPHLVCRLLLEKKKNT